MGWCRWDVPHETRRGPPPGQCNIVSQAYTPAQLSAKTSSKFLSMPRQNTTPADISPLDIRYFTVIMAGRANRFQTPPKLHQLSPKNFVMTAPYLYGITA